MSDINNISYTDPLLQCLVIITKLNNRPFSAEALIEGLPTEMGMAAPELFSLTKPKAGFSRAAARAGFASKLVKKDLLKISPLVLPCILILKDSDACILVEFDAKKEHAKIIIPDLEESETWVKTEELQSLYLGFSFYLKKKFDGSEKEEPLLKEENGHWFWGTIWKSRKIYYDVFVASLLINLFVLASPLFVMNVYDRVVPNNAVETLWVLAIGVIVIYLLDTILKYIRAYFLEIAGKKADIIMSSMIFEKVMNMKMSSRYSSVGSFANNLKEFESIRSFFTSSTISAIIDLPFVAIFMLVINFIAGAIVVAPLTIMAMIIIYALFIKSPLNKSIESTYKAAAHKNSVLIESLVNLETIKSLGGSGRAQYQWEEASGEIANKSLKTRIISSSIQTTTSMLMQLNTVVVIVYGVYLIKEVELSMGGLVATVLLSSRAIAPIGRFASLITSYEQTKTAYKNINDIMNLPVDRPEGKEFVKRPEFKGEIEFKNVTFTYPNETKASLKDVSFKIKPHERVGIIGRIGSGKSTIAKLLLGLYTPESGSILIDGIDINQIDPADLRRNIGYVPQSVSLFRGSIKENIVYKAPYVSDIEILRAAQISTVDDFVRLHPKGYDMDVGERGETLSGGQRQCVGIARAFLVDAPFLVLDELTESMDNSTEEKILKNVDEYSRSKTVIMATHKMSLIKLVNRLIVMDNGIVVLDGEKNEVMKKLTTPPPSPASAQQEQQARKMTIKQQTPQPKTHAGKPSGVTIPQKSEIQTDQKIKV